VCVHLVGRVSRIPGSRGIVSRCSRGVALAGRRWVSTRRVGTRRVGTSRRITTTRLYVDVGLCRGVAHTGRISGTTSRYHLRLSNVSHLLRYDRSLDRGTGHHGSLGGNDSDWRRSTMVVVVVRVYNRLDRLNFLYVAACL
jgi:hypothetical protein